jgi:glycosyltransferase involved in cell wall biosynthesis
VRLAVLGIKALPAYAGADRVVEHLLEHLSPEIHATVYLVAAQGERLTCTERRRYVYLPALPGKHLRATSFFLLSSLHVLLKDGYDVVHLHNSELGIFGPLLRLRRHRIVGTFHSDPYLRAKWGRLASAVLRIAERLFVRCCDGLTSVSAQKLVPGRIVHHIPNGVDLSPPPPTDECVPEAAKNGPFLLFAAGRVDRTKGLHDLLAAYGDLETDLPLVVVGDFSHDAVYSTEIERAVAADPRVVVQPTLLDRPVLLDLVRRSAVFVFPSLVEGMSMVLLEAVSVGALVVCSDISENTDVVGTAYPYLFAPGNASELREVLTRAVAERAAWDPEPLLRDVEGRLRWPSIAAAYERVYQEVIEAPTRGV